MWYLIIPAIVLLDQVTKIWATQAFVERGVQQILPIFNLTLAHNTGVSFSFFENLPSPWILIGLATLMTGFLFYWQAKEKDTWNRVALLVVIGGAIGNIIDRIRLGAVIDFLDVHWQQYHWPAFNVADMAVVCGMGLLFLSLFNVPSLLLKREKS